MNASKKYLDTETMAAKTRSREGLELHVLTCPTARPRGGGGKAGSLLWQYDG